MSWLTDKFRDDLKKKVGEIESKTSLEFVPVFVRSSSDYFTLRVLYFLVSLVLGYEFFSNALNIWNPTHRNLIALGSAFLVGMFAIWSPIFRRLISAKYKHQKVEAMASRMFLIEEVFTTKQRSGILVLVSEFERSVFILADKGILTHTSATEIQSLGESLAKDFNSKRPGDSFFMAIEALASKLAPHFPPNADGNELKDHLRS